MLLKLAGKISALFGDGDNGEAPEDALGVLQAQAAQRHFSWNELNLKPPKKNPRSAFLDGLSLHADTHIHQNDRKGLEKLCRYGARGALSLERLSQRSDGKYVYRLKKAKQTGEQELVLTGLELVRKVAALVPPVRLNLCRFFGVFAPGSRLRAGLAPSTVQPDTEPVSSSACAGSPEKSKTDTKAGKSHSQGICTKGRKPRLDWASLLRRTFQVDVFTCDKCTGRRRVVAFINKPSAARDILKHLGLPAEPPRLARSALDEVEWGQGPPEQLEFAA